MKIVIVSGGKPPREQNLKKYIDNETFIISADSGSNILYKYNIIPDIILGDFDSIDREVINYFREKKCKIISYPTEKNFTDTEAALKEAIKMSPDSILLFGCTGSRLDHTFANLGLLYRCLISNIEAYIIDENNTISLHNEAFKIEGKRGDLFSLQAFGSVVKGLSISKAKYELNNYDLKFGDPRTVSNELMDGSVFITFHKGILLLIKSKD
ncbi:thiamine pyrophosphokinase [Clostridium pasteurianum DSM 525 = ATCC 6013]|uniref:Thiamine diphosphokinase n=1 Tax=Clostridium pasteurianum DSM 525 = ATCC 6013 TaxID=1262449 RepID=A0A0H3J2L3_CLOPA|nr:thiamine diphosphokinase [Clostridium pasteurianum]AJA48166.1 thiamine pyrophosphokinase [Clostridium pasteurianum DSM 525 = ATCC 6013]AJA52154.1 thiamine pyrophosphokinase [Clostridium pasteurianum DSM 525 = ATCC 6013]AOZ75426.1 thiamine pyrophosphokinase [Clostridium pasteurianum DSM 525 = ATCC 6013]AOZ79221.1 thiamine pyrophosphokinase [Clostridium pasteurianum]ELP60682.1 thiamine pyrophosphokinase [Clostridium pasteurianum DSM 525 = ATCC 6013]